MTAVRYDRRMELSIVVSVDRGLLVLDVEASLDEAGIDDRNARLSNGTLYRAELDVWKGQALWLSAAHGISTSEGSLVNNYDPELSTTSD
jgi:hypothetical protein